ncbi:MAG: PQQ-binding-like beta-propeller repeat protein [Oligoflexia bacterium]|jgi:outer membrane protein assembly factor BamB
MTVRTFMGSIGLGGFFLLIGAGCSGPELRRGFKPKAPVFERQWSIATRQRPNEAGERGVEYSNAVVFENTVIFGTSEAGLVALYPELGGATRWALPIKGGVTNEIHLHGPFLYFGAADGQFYCVNVETGQVQWRYELKNPKISKPTFHGNKLFITTTDNAVLAFEATTGRNLWIYRRKIPEGATVHGASQPWTDGAELLAGMSDGYLVVLDAVDGRVKSEKRLTNRTKFTDIDGSPVLNGQVFYVGSYDGELYALKKGSLDILWKIEAGAGRSVVIDSGTLYVASSDRKVRAVDPASGKVLWSFEMDGGAPTQPIVTERWVIVGSSYQYLYALDRKTGELQDRWNVGYGSGLSGNLLYDAKQKMLYLVSGAANLYTLRVR